MNVGEMQRKLSQWAERERHHRFFDLYHLLYDKDWLRLAYDHIRANAGSKTAGCDGVGRSDFDKRLDEHLAQLGQELKAGTFTPLPVRRVYLYKNNGKRRSLGIQSMRDRIVQEALRMLLEPIYEADFSQLSFGFRPNRCTMDAVKYLACNTIGAKKYYWCIEGDISAYFDSLCQKKLITLLRRRIKDRKLLRLLKLFLRAGVMEGKHFQPTPIGVPQGAILSPLLANVYLHELDQFMEKYTTLTAYQRARRRQQGKGNFIYARYADDFVVLCNGTRAEAEAMKQELTTFLSNELKLTLSEEKTKVTHLNEGFEFLGFRIQRCQGTQGLKTKILIPAKAKTKLLLKLKHCTDASQQQEAVNAKILALNRIVAGWCRYYQYTSCASTEFSRMQYRLFWLMAHWLGRKHKLSISQVCQRYKRRGTFATKDYRLLKINEEFTTRRYRASVFKPIPIHIKRSSSTGKKFPPRAIGRGLKAAPGWLISDRASWPEISIAVRCVTNP